MNTGYLVLGIIFVLSLLVLGVKLRSSEKGVEDWDDVEEEDDWDSPNVEHCGSVCPNSGTCNDCGIGFP